MIRTGIQATILLSWIVFLSFDANNFVKAFTCFTSSRFQHHPCGVALHPPTTPTTTTRTVQSRDDTTHPNSKPCGPSCGSSHAINHSGTVVLQNTKGSRLFSVPKYLVQEIRGLFHDRPSNHRHGNMDDDDDKSGGNRDEGTSTTMNVLLQELADHYDCSDAQGKHELLQRLDDQIEDLAERIAVLKSLSEHLQMGDDYLLQDQEISAMKRFLWTTASSLKCGKHVEYLDGKEVNGLKTEIISAIQQVHEPDQSMELFDLQDDYLETKMKEQEDESWKNSYDAWLGF